MPSQYQNPSQLLSDYVRSVLIVEEFSEVGDLPVIPMGTPVLLIRVENQALKITACRQLDGPESLNLKPGCTLFAFFFKPFLLGPVFGIGAKQLKTGPVDLSDRLETPDSQDLPGAAEKFVAKQIARNKSACQIIRVSTDLMLLYPKADVQPEILRSLGITERTFQRHFKKYVGITPGQFRRICQFQTGFSQVRNEQFHKLSDVAFQNGYADQSHFIRAFKEFTKTTPGDYLKSGLE